MLTDQEIKKLIKKIEKGAKYLEEFDNLGAKYPDRKKPATFTLNQSTLKKLEAKKNKSRFVEKAIVEALTKEAKT